MEEMFAILNWGFNKPKILTPLCHAHRVVRIFEFFDQIFRRNQNQIRNLFSFFIRGPDGFEPWKTIKVEISLHAPLNSSEFYVLKMIIYNVVLYTVQYLA